MLILWSTISQHSLELQKICDKPSSVFYQNEFISIHRRCSENNTLQMHPRRAKWKTICNKDEVNSPENNKDHSIDTSMFRFVTTWKAHGVKIYMDLPIWTRPCHVFVLDQHLCRKIKWSKCMWKLSGLKIQFW